MIIRTAKRGDEGAIIDLIRELAEFEKEPDAVKNTPEKLAVDLFESKVCDALVVELEDQVIGYAIYYTSYSTWNGPCLYLEDIYIKQNHRGNGIGSKLFNAVREVAIDRKVARMDWQILDWNQDALDFYKNKGARIDSDWLNGRLFFDD